LETGTGVTVRAAEGSDVRLALNIKPAAMQHKLNREMFAHIWEHGIAAYVALAAPGRAFFATLGLVPAVNTLTPRSGTQFDWADVDRQPPWLDDVLSPPACSFSLIADQPRHLVIQPRACRIVSPAISILQTFWGATAGRRSTLSALTVAGDGRPHRHVRCVLAVSLVTTLHDMLGSVLALAVPPAGELTAPLERLSASITTNPTALAPRASDGAPTV
jgi:hypothetical protein